MALNLVSARLLTRSNGNCTIDHAAYIDRTRYLNEKTGEWTRDYSDKGGIEARAVWVPEGAPEWMKDPQKLWNGLENKEDEHNHHATALLSRSWIMTIPKELDTEQKRLYMAKDMATEFTKKGWVVQWAVHEPDKDNNNYHVHMQSPMRYITPEGFGKRREANSDKEFDKKKDELSYWKGRWSEIGARHLERYGHKLEAQRYRAGHEARDNKLGDALDRKDMELADRLEDKPHVHLGPVAFHREKNGERTRNGDKNRAIDEYNKQRQAERQHARLIGKDAPDNLRGAARELWWAYNGTRSAAEFHKSLQDRGFQAVRTNEQDVNRSRVEFASEKDGKYVHQYFKGELLILTDKGQILRLNDRTTGDSQKDIRTFTGPLDNVALPGLAEARDVQMNRPQEKIRSDGYLRDALPVWWAYNCAKTIDQLPEFLKNEKLELARITGDDQTASKTNNWMAERNGRYSAVYREGEYVVVNEKGHVYRLTEKNTGRGLKEVEAFMKPLDGKPVRDLRTVMNQVQERIAEQTDLRPARRRKLTHEIKHEAKKAVRSTSRALTEVPNTLRTGKRVASKVLGILNIFDNTPTPEQREEAKIRAEERELDKKIPRKEHVRGGDRER